jgi:peptidoglycan/LPS O-acetylase OafA/YrhL
MLGSRQPASSPAAEGRLAFLDGLRGLAALYVVLHHAALEVRGASAWRVVELARGLLRHGHFAVAVFIVLSGYCLMRPVANDPLGRLQGGVRGYLRRRVRRILPPYYAALGLCWLLIAVVPGLDRAQGVRWDRALPAFEPGVVASHALLYHNLNERWIFKVDPPLWSVATEWQIYLIFPGLLAVWRRYGSAAAVGAAFAGGFCVAALGGWLGAASLMQLCPWYAGLFALGMAGAALARSGPADARDTGPGRLIAAGGGVLAVAFAGMAARSGADWPVMMTDLGVGAAASGLVIRLARQASARRAASRAAVLTLLQSRAAVSLGAFSYSLYLIHFPILALCGRAVRSGTWGVEVRVAMMVVAAPLVCVVAAYLFHLVFEYPLGRGASLPVAVVLARGMDRAQGGVVDGEGTHLDRGGGRRRNDLVLAGLDHEGEIAAEGVPRDVLDAGEHRQRVGARLDLLASLDRQQHGLGRRAVCERLCRDAHDQVGGLLRGGALE